MILYIDSREPKNIKDYLNYLNLDNKYKIEITNLDIGDYIIYDEIQKKNLVIIERKSLNDLESSIKDGRYIEQSFRLNNNNVINHNIYYLIEGSIINYKNNSFKNTLYSSLVSISYFKGFSILNTINSIESAELINSFINKLVKENNKKGYFDNNRENNIDNIDNIDNTNLNINNITNNLTNNNDTIKTDYTNVIKTSKKSHVTRDNINTIMLMQIPNISNNTALTIINKYKTIKNLIECLENDNNCLDSLKIESSNRKISKTIIQNIKIYLLN